jgi:hypothetical protein
VPTAGGVREYAHPGERHCRDGSEVWFQKRNCCLLEDVSAQPLSGSPLDAIMGETLSQTVDFQDRGFETHPSRGAIFICGDFIALQHREIL